jgi:hypothetical protein
MNKSTMIERTPRRRRPARAARQTALALLATTGLLFAGSLGAGSATAYWSADGSASATATTAVLEPPTNVTVPSTANGTVSVSWAAPVGSVAAEGYFVTRTSATDSTNTSLACGTTPSAPTTSTVCSDTVIAGSYYYTVIAVHRTWTRASAASGTVTVPETSVLGAAESYSVLARTAVTTTTASALSGDVGVSPGSSLVGFAPSMVGGDIHINDAHAAAAQLALGAALADLQARIPFEPDINTDLGGRTLTPGVYHSAAALALTGVLILDAEDNPDAVFVFQTDGAFDTAADSTVVLTNGAQASNIFWVTKAAAGTGARSFLAGSILAAGAITLGASTQVIGRALSQDAVTLAGDTIRFTVSLPPTVSIAGGAVAVGDDITPTISGTTTAPASSAVTVTVAGQMLYSTVQADGTWSVTATSVAAGTYAVVAKVRDASGNGTAADQSLTVQVNPPTVALGTAATYSVLAGTTIVETGTSSLSGDVGLSPGGSISGFPDGSVAGATHNGDSAAEQAQVDLVIAITDASSRALHTEIVGDLGGRIFHVGVHHSTAALAITGTVTLDAQGDPNAVFIFQTDAAFNTSEASRVFLENGAQASNVFWVVQDAVCTGTNSFLSGTILARGAITLGSGMELEGQALSEHAVTLADSTLTGIAPAPVPAASSAAPEPEPTPIPAPTPTPSPTPPVLREQP